MMALSIALIVAYVVMNLIEDYNHGSVTSYNCTLDDRVRLTHVPLRAGYLDKEESE